MPFQHQLCDMEDPSAQFQHEPDLVDILWRQDADLGVEREIFDGCLRQKTEETQKVREREQKRERELERIMQRLQKQDKETGEFLPGPASENFQALHLSATLPSAGSTQHLPVTQNPLLTALLFSKSQKAPSEEQAFSELQSVPDLQYYLDLLESESPNMPLEDIIEICSHNPSNKKSSTDAFCDLGELTQTVSDSIDVAQPLLCPPCIPAQETFLPTLSDSGDSVCSPLNTIFSSSPLENQMSLTKCQLISNQSTVGEFCPELTSTYTIRSSTLSQQDESDGSPEWETSHALSCVADSPVLIGFDDSASAESVDLDTSLYTTDSISGQSEEEELKSIQSNCVDLLSISLDSEVLEELYETVKHQTPGDSLENLIQREPLPNLTTTRGKRRVCRDEQRARALGLPLSVQDIISLPVEAFNEVISSSKLSHAQLSLVKDIRRRGKNKMAAQSCRKRKLNSLVDLEEEVEALKKQKEQVIEEQERNSRDLQDTKEKLKKLYNEVFRQLRDEHGNPYNPNMYKLQLSTDGTVYLLPRSTASKIH